MFPKCSAFTASLPTSPTTNSRCKRGCSCGDCDSESDSLGYQGSALWSTDEEDRIKSLKGWWRRSVLDSRTQVRNTTSEGFWWGIVLRFRQGRRGRCCRSFISCSVVVSQPILAVILALNIGFGFSSSRSWKSPVLVPHYHGLLRSLLSPHIVNLFAS